MHCWKKWMSTTAVVLGVVMLIGGFGMILVNYKQKVWEWLSYTGGFFIYMANIGVVVGIGSLLEYLEPIRLWSFNPQAPKGGNKDIEVVKFLYSARLDWKKIVEGAEKGEKEQEELNEKMNYCLKYAILCICLYGFYSFLSLLMDCFKVPLLEPLPWKFFMSMKQMVMISNFFGSMRNLSLNHALTQIVPYFDIEPILMTFTVGINIYIMPFAIWLVKSLLF